MKNLIKFFFYVLTVFSFLFMTSNKVIGPLCMRHIVALCLFIYSCFYIKKFRFDRIETLFFAYLFVYIICNIVNGEFFLTTFFTNFLSYHFSSIVLILSIPIIVKSKRDLNLFVGAIAISYFSNCILTIGQFFSFPPSWEIGQMVNDGLTRELENNADIFEYDGGLLGRTITAGFTGFVVTNGYFTTCYLPIAHQVLKAHSKYVFFPILIIVALAVTFINQERAAMLLVLLYFLFYVFMYYKPSKLFLLFGGLLLLFFYCQDAIFNSMEMGRLMEFSDSTRGKLWRDFRQFLYTDQLYFGGLDNYISVYKVNQHNCLLAAWTIGGIFTFLSFCVLYFYALYELARMLFNWDFIKSNIIFFSLATSCGLYLLYSLTHSSGLQNDGVMFWLPYTLLLVYKKLYNIPNEMTR